MARERIVILGGGFAGLETTFLLRHRLHDEVELALVSDTPEFLYRPNTIYIPFGLDPEKLRIPLDQPTRRQQIDFFQGTVADVDPEAGRIEFEDRPSLSYDQLVIATGADMRPTEVPGLAEHATTIWTPKEMLKLRREIERIIERAEDGKVTRLLFLVPPNNKCSGPLYEMVFMIDTHLRRKKVRDAVEIVWTSAEHSYIQAFGPRIHEVVAEEFGERHIAGYLEHVVTEVTDTQVHFENGETFDYDSLISFPPYIAKVHYSDLPTDDRGFIQTDPASRAVTGFPNIYAPGDAGDFPVKQAFLAFLQADATAEAIVGKRRGTSPRVTFDPISMCVMEQFDKAVFAQVPLRTTGDPDYPVEVRPDADGEYKVGVSPLWRLGKKMLGFYLPMRFRAGEPFHAGTAWTMMEVGLKGMSGVLAD